MSRRLKFSNSRALRSCHASAYCSTARQRCHSLRERSICCSPWCGGPASWQQRTNSSWMSGRAVSSKTLKHPHRQEETRSARDPARAVERYPAAWHDHVDVRVVGHCRAPAMEHGGGADACAEMLGIGGDREQRLSGRSEQEVVDHGLVLVSDRGDL